MSNNMYECVKGKSLTSAEEEDYCGEVILKDENGVVLTKSNDEDEEEEICPHCERNETDCEANTNLMKNPITYWLVWGLSCDECYYKNHPESDDDEEEEVRCMRCNIFMEKKEENKDGVWYSCDDCLKQEDVDYWEHYKLVNDIIKLAHKWRFDYKGKMNLASYKYSGCELDAMTIEKLTILIKVMNQQIMMQKKLRSYNKDFE
jgi:hypothetical protein